MLRKGAESALVELVFTGNERVRGKLEELELEQSEDPPPPHGSKSPAVTL